jgi:hypothetical protein
MVVTACDLPSAKHSNILNIRSKILEILIIDL